MEEITRNKRSVGNVALTYGMLTGVVLILFDLTMYLTGLVWNEFMNYFIYVLTAICIILAHRKYIQDNDMPMSYARGAAMGVMITFIGFFISSVFNYLYTLYVDDIIIDVVIKGQEDAMVAQGMSYEQVEMAMSASSSFLSPNILIPYYFVVSFVIGAIISLILPLITRFMNPATAKI